MAKPTKLLSWIVSGYLYGAFDCMSLSCHVRISEWIHVLYLPESQEHLGPNRSDIWNLSDCHGTRTHNHLVLKKALNELAKSTKGFSWIVSRYLYRAFDCMSLSCHVRISEWIHFLYLPECQERLGPNRSDMSNLSECHGTRTHNHLFLKKALNHSPKATKCLSSIVSRYLYRAFDSSRYHVLYAFQSQSTVFICLNVKGLLGTNKSDT